MFCEFLFNKENYFSFYLNNLKELHLNFTNFIYLDK